VGERATLLIVAAVCGLLGSSLLVAGLLSSDGPLMPIRQPTYVTPLTRTFAPSPRTSISTPASSPRPFVPIGTPPTYTYILNPCMTVLRPARCPTAIITSYGNNDTGGS
jgi:hypothetical protein